MDLTKNKPRIFYGWYIVTASAFIMIFTGGVTHLGFTTVFEPIAEEFGWSYAQISLAASLRGFESGLLAPLIGFLVDRWGPRKLIFGGGILLCLGFLLLSQINSLIMFYASFVIIAIGMSTCMGTVMLTAVASWFRRKYGLASGIVASGFGLGGIMVPIMTMLIYALEWRMALVTIGFSTLAVVLPLSLVMRHKPEQYGYQPDGGLTNTAIFDNTQISSASPEISFTAKQALKHRAFWHIAIAGACQAFIIGAVVTHIMPYLSSIGANRSVSSFIALMIPLTSIGGRLSGGWLCDRVGRKPIFIASFTLMTIGLLVFAFVTENSLWLLIPFVITFSFGWGFAVTTRISLLREHFGIGSFGKIFGLMTGIVMLGNMSGAPLAGWIYDTWQNYQGAWLLFCAVTITAIILTFTLPRKSSALTLG
ncbi:MFS transporter [Chloroflexota bacterium]